MLYVRLYLCVYVFVWLRVCASVYVNACVCDRVLSVDPQSTGTLSAVFALRAVCRGRLGVVVRYIFIVYLLIGWFFFRWSVSLYPGSYVYIYFFDRRYPFRWCPRGRRPSSPFSRPSWRRSRFSIDVLVICIFLNIIYFNSCLYVFIVIMFYSQNWKSCRQLNPLCPLSSLFFILNL